MVRSARLRLPPRDATRTDMTWRPWSAVQDLVAGPADTTWEHDLTRLDGVRTDDDPPGVTGAGGSTQITDRGAG